MRKWRENARLFFFIFLFSFSAFSLPKCQNPSHIPALRGRKRKIARIKKELSLVLSSKLSYDRSVEIKDVLMKIGIQHKDFLRNLESLLADDSEKVRQEKKLYLYKILFCTDKGDYSGFSQVLKQLKALAVITESESICQSKGHCSQSRTKKILQKLIHPTIKRFASKIKFFFEEKYHKHGVPFFKRIYSPLKKLKRRFFSFNKKKERVLTNQDLAFFYSVLKKKKARFKKKYPDKKFPMKEFMENYGYKAVFKNVNLARVNYTLNIPQYRVPIGMEKTDLLSDIDFTGVDFVNVRAKYVNFSGSVFGGDQEGPSRIVNSNFSKSSFENSAMNHLVFEKSILHDTDFHDSKIGNTIFKSSSLKFSSFEKVRIPPNSTLVFEQSNIDYTNFFQVPRNQVKFSFSSAQVMKTKRVFFTKDHFSKDIPIIGMPWNPNANGYSIPRVKETLLSTGNMMLVRTNLNFRSIDKTVVESEFQRLLERCKELEGDYASTAQCVIGEGEAGQDQFPQIGKIIQEAFGKTNQLDSVILAGGENVDPRFYGGRKAKWSGATYNLLRDLFEMATIKKAQERGIPLLGICRGLQVYNTFEGGKLKFLYPSGGEIDQMQTLRRNKEVPLKSHSPLSIVKGKQLFMHAQYVGKVAPGLKVLDTYHVDGRGVPASIIDKRYPNVSLTQFHPEFYNELEEEHGWFTRRDLERQFSSDQVNFWTKVLENAKHQARSR